MAGATTAAAAAFSTLPTELVVLVARLLTPKHQAALAKTSHFFRNILSPTLYTENIAQGRSSCLFWAAQHGVVCTLENALAFGADLNTRFFPQDEATATPADGGDENQDDNEREDSAKEGRVSYTAISVAARHGQRHIVGWLLNHGADINAPASKYCECRYVCSDPQNVISTYPMPGWRPLHTAMCHGHTQVAELLLFCGASIHNVSANENIVVPALHGAASHCLVPLIKTLALDADLDVNETDSFGNTALHYACLSWVWNAAPVRKLLALGAEIDALNNDGFTPLLYACRKGNFTAALALVHAGANPEPHAGWIPGFTDVRPLYYCTRRYRRFTPQPVNKEIAAWESNQIMLLRALIEAGADMEARFNRVWRQKVTSLMLAARHGMARAVRVLCESGAVVNAADDKDRTALYVACESPDTDVTKEMTAEIVEVLLTHGARIDMGKRGSTVLDWAVKEWKNKQTLIPGKIMERTTVSNVSQIKLQPIVKSCAAAGNAVAVRALLTLEKKLFDVSDREVRDLIDITISKSNSRSTLNAILEFGQTESTESMLWKCMLEQNQLLALDVIARGVAVSNVRFWGNQTYLHMACKWGDLEVVEALLERGADVNVFDRDLRTPLSIAVTENNRDVADALMREVADPHLTPSDDLLYECFDESGIQMGAKYAFLTAFDLAIQQRRVGILEDMLGRFVLPDIPPRSRSSYVHRACRNLELEPVVLLLEKGADPNGGPDCLDPPLNSLLRSIRNNPSPPDFAAQVLRPASRLLKFGADANLRDFKDETAFEILQSIEQYDGPNTDLSIAASWTREQMETGRDSATGKPTIILHSDNEKWREEYDSSSSSD